LFVVLLACGSQEPTAPEAPPGSGLEAEMKMLDSMVVACMAKTGPLDEAGAAFGELAAWMKQKGIEPLGPPMGIYMDDPEKEAPEETKYEVCFPVAMGVGADPEAGVEVRPFGGMQVAAAWHIGAYDKVGYTYSGLAKWIGDEGYDIVGPGISIYHSDPTSTPVESLKTEVCFPVQHRAEQ